MNYIRQAFILLLILIPQSVFSQDIITEKEKGLVIESIKELIASNYVFIDKIKYINDALDSLNSTNNYNDITKHEAFADKLTKDLVTITNDRHFKVQYNPELVESRRIRRQQEIVDEEEMDEEELFDWNLWYAKKENFGFQKIEILDGNIGYIKFDFWHQLNLVKPTIDATMRFVKNTDALIIDLTENGGGYSPTDIYFGSYFFNQERAIWSSSYNRPTNKTETEYTFEQVEGEHYLNKPVYILVSDKTFSLAEKFAYNMKHFNKAKIVGQTSAGAAHAIDFMEVNDEYMIQLPVSRSINPITKLDWEGVGVIPDITASNSDVLKTAHLSALNIIIERLEKQTLVGPILDRYYKIRKDLMNSSDMH